ncbi:sensor histidine kinase [Marinobacterium rhizophilum]|uniref:sensor histidine kinase n=1 Tax=Marinobacterium rhizophilum TaxID=420402 RepID=UPI000364963C|nr:sensor histidine kinase [Marinobacterium rhizophilum]
MSIYQRIIVACTGLAIAAIVAFGLLSYRSGQELLQMSVRDRLDAVASNQRDKITEVVKAWEDRVALIASRTQLRMSLKSYLATKDPESFARITRILSDAQQSVRAVHSIAVAPLQGPSVAQSGPPLDGVKRSIRFRALAQEVQLVAMLLDGQGQLFVQYEMPMRLEATPIGRVTVTLRADELLKATRDFTGLGASGETMLVAFNADNQPVYLAPLRHDSTVALDPLPNDEGVGKALIEALFGNNGLLEHSVDYRGQDVMAATRYLAEPGWGVVVKMDQNEISAPVLDYQNQLTWLAVILLLVAVVLGVLLARAIVRPVVKLASDTRRIRQGDRDLRAQVSPRQARELKELAVSFNSLTDSLMEANATLEKRVEERTAELQTLNERLEHRVEARTGALREKNEELTSALNDLNKAQEELVRVEKMAALGGLVAGVAHEINTPLGIGITGASHLKDAIRDIEKRAESNQITRGDLSRFLNSTKQSCDVMLAQLSHAASLVSDFKQVAVDQANPDIRTVELDRYLEKVVVTLQPKFKHTPHIITVSTPGDITITTCPGALAQALTALITNCLTHAFDGDDCQSGEIIISAETTRYGCCLRVCDNGKGIKPEHLPKIFDPFFTTARGRGGCGLGLSIVHNIVTEVLKGSISCESQPSEGTCFSIQISELNQRVGGDTTLDAALISSS